MSYPQNPETIILKNKFYSAGLKEIDVWNYYQKVKGQILDETRGRNLIFVIMTDINKPVIRRKQKSGNIRLTPQNYDTVITGRSISMYSEMGMSEDIGIIDIDIHPDDGIKWAKKATLDTYDFVMDKMPLVQKAEIRYTGKHSFHIFCKFGRKMKPDVIRFLLDRELRKSDLSKVYTVGGKRTRGVPNLDLSPNKIRGGFITLGALSIIGLRCMVVPFDRLKSFDPRQARIK